MTHTPTPWYATGVNDMKKTMGIYCSDCGNQMPREDLKSRVGAGMTNDALVEAYRAVNAHDALVKALVCAEADIEGLVESEADDHPAWQTLKEIRAALQEVRT